MEVIAHPKQFRERRRKLAEAVSRQQERQAAVGFVPTMGNLHAGHMSLIETMRQECDLAIVSIYVNPMQFAANEDLAEYPRTLEDDLAKCEQAGVELVFTPTDEVMYPQGFQTRVEVTRVSQPWEGAHRPTHFAGVATVVAKLLNITEPDRAYFGQKDYQQFRVLDRMVRDLDFPTELVMCPIVRDSDGLALSSRNQYLSADERKAARTLFRCLQAIEGGFQTGILAAEELMSKGRALLAPEVELQYLAVVDAESLAEKPEAAAGDVVLIAAKVGGTHLIDNLILGGGR